MPRAARRATDDNDGRRVLFADDDPLVRKSVQRLLKGVCDLASVGTHAEALRVAAEEPLVGVIADLVFPGGKDGFQIIELARARDARLPALLVTGHLDHRVAARAFTQEITFLPKPLKPDNLRGFASRCLLHPIRGHVHFDTRAREWEERYHLTPTECEVLVATARGMSRDELLTTRGIAETTLKRHVTNLLEKTGAVSLDRAALHFLGEVLRDLE